MPRGDQTCPGALAGQVRSGLFLGQHPGCSMTCRGPRAQGAGTLVPIPAPVPVPDLPRDGDGASVPDLPGGGDSSPVPVPVPDLSGLGIGDAPPSPSPISACDLPGTGTLPRLRFPSGGPRPARRTSIEDHGSGACVLTARCAPRGAKLAGERKHAGGLLKIPVGAWSPDGTGRLDRDAEKCPEQNKTRTRVSA
jgi:hypothetical protein